MFKAYRKYPCPKWYDLFITCHTHGWINLAPFSWDETHSRLEFALLMASKAVDVSIQQDDHSIEAVICSETKINSKPLKCLDYTLARILGLEEETTGLFKTAILIGGSYPKLMRKGAGRLLRGATLWEDAAKTLFTTNCSWALTQKMCEKICSSAFSIPSPSGRYPFPLPSFIAKESPSDLRKKLPVGYRAEYLKLLAKVFRDDPELSGLESGKHSYEEASNLAAKLKGFGPYARTHLLIIAGYYEKIPIDSEVLGYIKGHFKSRHAIKFIERRYRAWGRNAWWGFKLEKMLRRQNWIGD